MVAQDLTYYGIDLYGKNQLAELIGRIADIEGLNGLLHYACRISVRIVNGDA
ncbi:MAG: hypothetical protein ACLUOS_06580 [Odoribacter splanchnicus]